MEKKKTKKSEQGKQITCYVLYKDPKQLPEIEKHVIKPLREGFKTGKLIWPDLSNLGKGDSKNA